MNNRHAVGGNRKVMACNLGVKDDSGSRKCHEIAVRKKRREAYVAEQFRKHSSSLLDPQEAVGVGSKRSL